MPIISWLNESVETHIGYFVQSKAYRELNDLTNHSVQFDWRIDPGHTTAKSLPEINKMMAEKNTLHQNFKEGSSS